MSEVSAASRIVDFSTLSNAVELKAEHAHLDLDVDFDQQSLIGSVTYSISTSALKEANTKAGTTQFILDTKDITIESAGVALTGEAFEPTQHRLSPDPKKLFGSALHVQLPVDKITASSESDFWVKINYRTKPECTACQWVDKESTSEKKYPYLFTQCQAIHARSLLPCQDCPSAKLTYSAKITSPEWSQSLMSAILLSSDKADGKNVFKFEQKVPVPSYLIALVTGNLAKRDISSRVAVWSEPMDVEKVAFEFAESEEFLQIAEKITGLDYQWGRYDVLCLPPSFPYGGMENPCLTFVTPTLLAGDRSLADVVAHEISHSWTGNVITNHTWEHFWLNEGWTVWLERKIKGEKASRAAGGSESARQEAQQVAAAVGLAHLTQSCEMFVNHGVPEHSKMVPNLEGVDPDDVFSSVPYEKGFNLLNTIEMTIGSDKFLDVLVKEYIGRFKFKLITSKLFQEFCCELFPQLSSTIDWEKWFFGIGMPEIKFEFKSEGIEAARGLANVWAAGVPSKDDIEKSKALWPKWGTEVRLVFLETLLKDTGLSKPFGFSDIASKQAFESAFSLNETKNCELLNVFYQILLKKTTEDSVWRSNEEQITTFLTSQGRMKYTRPLYRALGQRDLTAARTLFDTNKNFYHPICRMIVDKDLNALK